MTVHDPDVRLANRPPAASDPTEAGGILRIDLAAIEANWKMLAGMTVPVECAAVVKANAMVVASNRLRARCPEPGAGPSSSPTSSKDGVCERLRPTPPSTCSTG